MTPSMPLNIRGAATDKPVRALAKKKGLGPTEAVRLAAGAGEGGPLTG